MENNKQSSIDILMKSILESDVELYISMQESGEFEQIKAMHKEEIESNNKINLAINEFERLKSKAGSIRDIIYLDGILAVLDSIKNETLLAVLDSIKNETLGGNNETH